MTDAAVLETLREKIRAIEGRTPDSGRTRHPSGLTGLDALIGGLPCPGLVELAGPEGCGAVRLALALAAAATTTGWVAWVDRPHALYPPAAHAAGVVLERLLIVRPQGAEQGLWATEQLLRSGCFGLVVVVEGPERRGLRAEGVRYRRAARRGGCTALSIVRSAAWRRALRADVRIGVAGERLTVLRDRGGHGGRTVVLPAWDGA